MPFPVTINGNTYNLADFAGFNYTVSLPNIFNDLSVVTQQAAADRAAILAALANNGNLLIPQTQGRLDFVTTAQVRLVPAGGNFLWINGLNRPIPIAGVNLASTGLTDGTLYYVYAYMNGATMVLEASTTGHTADATGVRVKSGDATRTLVGMVYIDTGSTFASSGAKRFVRSYYNRPPLPLASAGASSNTTSTTATELSASFQIGFICFADDIIDVAYLGTGFNTGGLLYTILGIDGGNLGVQSVASASGGSTPNYPIANRATLLRPEGYHYLSLRGYVSAGTGQWVGQLQGSLG